MQRIPARVKNTRLSMSDSAVHRCTLLKPASKLVQFSMGLMDVINSSVHIPIWEDIVWYLFWTLMWALGPGIGGLIFLHDVVTGFFFSVFYMKGSLDKVIFVTGCDSGFGKSLAVKLARGGWKVYASCLTESGSRDLTEDRIANLHIVMMDVTKPEQVQAAADRVSAENPQGLYALVNNAGVSRAGLIDWLSLNDFRFCMEVNFYATISVTKAFLPLIKKTKGRIIVMSSVAGLSCGYPVTCAYSASKHAVEMWASTLRQEMRVWGIKVCTLNPGFHRTEINHNAAAAIRTSYERAPKDIQEQYGEEYLKATCDATHKFTVERAFDPKNVLKCYMHAITSTRPKVQYRVGLDAKLLFPFLQLWPLRFAEVVAYNASTLPGMRKLPAQNWALPAGPDGAAEEEKALHKENVEL